jgi:predicted nucleotidyltransferase
MKKYSFKKAGIFGSFVRGKEIECSDIDIIDRN